MDGVTVSAWSGFLKPFESDVAARSILRDMEAERALWISEGTIRPSEDQGMHWADPLLVKMDISCEVMLCIQVDAMPRAYLLSPRFQPFYADTAIHPHPRGDHTILYKGRPLPGLCVFSSAETIFRDGQDFHTQFLDQLTQYVAKHLIWLRTRRLCRMIAGKTYVLYQPKAGEQIIEQAPRPHWVQLAAGPTQALDFWSGYWPGKPARAITSAEHLRQIKPAQRCWCGLNKTYENCHRPLELALVG
jgi:hypothetical protein